MATIADVAKRAGVAPSTVSRVLSDSDYVNYMESIPHVGVLKKAKGNV